MEEVGTGAGGPGSIRSIPCIFTWSSHSSAIRIV
jgi:hypothetical protein